MRGSDQIIQKLKARVPVEAFVIFLAFVSTTSNASTGSSWSRPGSWANSNEENGNTTHRAVRSRESSPSNISPYSPGSNNLALDVGQVFLMGDLTKNYNDSLGTQVHYTYGVSDLFGFDSSLGYSEHSDGRYSMTTLLTGLRMNLSWYDKVIPYAIFGLGFYRPSYRDANADLTGVLAASGASNTSVSAVLFGVHLGPGIDLEINKNLFFGAALTLHNMFGTNKVANGSPFYIGGTFTSFLIHIGASF